MNNRNSLIANLKQIRTEAFEHIKSPTQLENQIFNTYRYFGSNFDDLSDIRYSLGIVALANISANNTSVRHIARNNPNALDAVLVKGNSTV